MTDIVFPDKHTVLFERDAIEFPAIVDGETIVCRLTLEEMLREFPERGSTPKRGVGGNRLPLGAADDPHVP